MAKSKTDTGDSERVADTIAELTKRWGCSRPHILKLIDQGELDDFWDGRNHKVVRKSSDGYIARKVASAKAARQATRKQCNCSSADGCTGACHEQRAVA